MTTSGSSCAVSVRSGDLVLGPEVLALVGGREAPTGGPLAGLRFGAKANLAVAGRPTTAGSRARADVDPETDDAVAVARLCRAGAELVAVLGMDELAYGFTGRNEHHGSAVNPRDPGRIPGGSSAGCGTAVARGALDLALGTDTNGSVRVPAACCGVYGMRLTQQPALAGGVVPLAPTLDVVGPIAARSEVLAAAVEVLVGPSAGPARSVHEARVATVVATPATPAVHAAVGVVGRALGAHGDVALGWEEVARSAARVITGSEAATAHEALRRDPTAALGRELRSRLVAGAALDPDDVADAYAVRDRLRADLDATFGGADLLLLPALAIDVPSVEATTALVDGIEQPLNPALGWHTSPFSFVGAPAVVVPVRVGEHDGPIPPAVQLVARPGHDLLLLAAVRALVAAGVTAAP